MSHRKRLTERFMGWLKARPWQAEAFAGGGGFLTVGFLAATNSTGALPLLMAPFRRELRSRLRRPREPAGTAAPCYRRGMYW